MGLNEGIAKFRYFFKEDLAFRLGLGFASKKSESTTVAVAPSTLTATTIIRTSNKTFTLGIEKHFEGSDRLSTFVGADLLISFAGASLTVTATDGRFSNLTGATGFTATDEPLKRAGSSLGFRVVTGADYYIAKKLYLGIEVGLQYSTGTEDSVSSSVKTVPSEPVVDTTLLSEGNSSETKTDIVGGIKIGYQF